MKRLDADWLNGGAIKRVFEVLSDYPTYAVGGCVRDTLLGERVKDIDLATAAHPDVVTDLAERAGLRTIPTGFDHGTVTIISGEMPFEVTTFRRDVATDGRRAVVAYSDSIEEDARRRDFTINAIYADARGGLHDPVSGLADIETRHVRFIEDAVRRIQEDFLRSLRFFRFNAWFGDPSGGFDAEALDAIAQNLPGLETLSRERVGSELLRLLNAPDPGPAVASMRATGVLAVILPGADDRALGPLVHLEHSVGMPPQGVRRLAVLGGAVDTLRLSRADLSRVERIQNNLGTAPETVGYREGRDIGCDVVLATAAMSAQPLQEDAILEVERGASATFPVTAQDLMPELEGKALGDKLRSLETAWIESGFTLSSEELLRRA